MKMVEGSKQVRVDNWGVFFLQRLQMFFSKTDYCDLTLQFEGNVQLKVHRLVMNACTEYFTILEQNYPAVEENTIMMPGDLQSDVIVPIVNFMYTGMLEFHMSIFEKLYSAADLMNITILTKLLDAQRVAYQQHRLKHKPKPDTTAATWTKKPPPPPKEKPPTVKAAASAWKQRRVAPHPVSQLHFPEPRFPMDPLSIPDNSPRPTRFEWPDDELPQLGFPEAGFEEVTLTSRPLLTKADEDKAKPSFDDVRGGSVGAVKKRGGGGGGGVGGVGGVDTADVEEFVREQRIRSAMFEDVDSLEGGGQKRKSDHSTAKQPAKKAKADKENRETTISVEGGDLPDSASIDHTKIVAEILKKYPDLVKRNKNIKLKIMTSGNNKGSSEKAAEKAKKTPVQAEPAKAKPPPTPKKQPEKKKEAAEEGPWVCRQCISMGAEPQEFVLYYLYRKHMTDVHNEVFDTKLCKYCGKRCATDNLMMYHMYTKHALKPPSGYNFPKCDRCPFIAQSSTRLDQHQHSHKPNEMQCQDCKLAFTSPATLGGHVRLTGHYNKPGKASFDCQYCMKKLQSAINLFTHIRNSHHREARRDGIVCLDELDSMEELDDGEEDGEEEEEGRDEYILPEMLPESVAQKDKVKIISNVKVPPHRQKADSGRAVRLDPSSEAESLTNVASGIAASLGLVDIVVLDDPRQFVLQQQAGGGGGSDAAAGREFVVPDVVGAGRAFAGQVIATHHDAVLQQGMIQSAGSEIGSTDELVMVLTDHEYTEDQEGDHSDNSNIVVLYSHPVEGQEGQFITSQGNLLVNSQTGMLEIRNGASIATSSAQQVVEANEDEAPVESIEMIHREIHGSTADMKEEPYYEQDGKSDAAFHQDDIPESREEVDESPSEETPEESVPQESLENSENKDDVPEEEESQEKERESEDVAGGNEDAEEPMEIDEIVENDASKMSQNDGHEQVYTAQDSSATSVEENDTTVVAEEENVCEEEAVAVQGEGSDVVDEKTAGEVTNETEIVINDPAILHSSENVTEEEASERMEVDGNEQESRVTTEEVDAAMAEEQTEPEETHTESEEINTEPEEIRTEPEETQAEPEEISTEPEETRTEPEESQTEPEEAQPEPEESQLEPEEAQTEPEEAQPEPEEAQTELEEGPAESEEAAPEDRPEDNQDPVANEEDDTSDAGNVLEENEDKAPDASGENEIREETRRKQVDINKTILDDWEEEDTDSQQSGKQAHEMSDSRDDENQTRAVENVNKLMDDWEEEDEEEKKDAE